MPNAQMVSYLQLHVGTRIVTKHRIERSRVSGWKFASEMPGHFSALPENSVLEIFEINKSTLPYWVKAWIPNTYNTMYLKIAGEELPRNFRLIQ